jgi:hypothetical protein
VFGKSAHSGLSAPHPRLRTPDRGYRVRHGTFLRKREFRLRADGGLFNWQGVFGGLLTAFRVRAHAADEMTQSD